MDFGIYAADTSKTIYLRLRDSTTGLAKTGLAYNSAGAIASYTLPKEARAAITLATQTVTGSWSSGGFVEVDATNCKGLYRLDLPNAAIASGDYTIISIQFTGVISESILIPLHVRKVNTTKVDGSDTAAANLKQSCLASVVGTVLADGSNTSTTFKVDTTLGAKSDDYFGNANGGLVLVFVSGTTNEYQSRRVIAFNGTTDFITVEEAFSSAPSASDTFVLLGRITELS